MKVTSPIATPGVFAWSHSMLRNLSSTETQILSRCVITSEGRHAWIVPGALPGRAVRVLMRRHNHTIRSLARKMGLTQKRVRQVRADGLAGWFSCGEWLFAITGHWFLKTSTLEVRS